MSFKKALSISSFPYFLSMLFSSLGIILNNNQFLSFNPIYLFIQWLTYTLMLVCIWFINVRIINYNFYQTLFINLILIVILSLMPIYLFSTHWYLQQANFRNFSSFFLLMFVASMIFVFFQKSLEIQLKNKVVELENIQLKSEKFSAELDHLKKQIDPHFLFNSFTVLHSLIRNDSKLAEQYLLNLTDLYRNILRNYSENTVSLEEELNLINSYLHLQKARFESVLHVDIQINKDVMRNQIPIFSLQLLFENCIKHNIVSDEKPLYITVFQKDNNLLCVKNNLQLKIRHEDSTGKGLANLKRRYELLGISDGLSIEQNHQSYSVTIKLL